MIKRHNLLLIMSARRHNNISVKLITILTGNIIINNNSINFIYVLLHKSSLSVKANY